MKRNLHYLFLIISCSALILWFYTKNNINQINNEITSSKNETQAEDLDLKITKSNEIKSYKKLHNANKFIHKKALISNHELARVIENKSGKYENEKRENIEARWKDEFEMTKDPHTGKVPKYAHLKALEAANRTSEYQLPESINQYGERALPTITVDPRGPFNFGGRTRAIGHDIRDPQIILAGGVSGGIMRSTNGGDTWTKVTPSNDLLSVTCIAQDPRAGNQDIWYCGSGEVLGNSASDDYATYYGHGIWKSTNNGQNWTALASTRVALENFDSDFDYVTRLLVDPTNGDVYAAANGNIQRSQNGGDTWSRVLGNSDNSNATTTDIVKQGNNFYASISSSGIWKSTTGNDMDWTQIANSTQLGDNFGRIVLATTAANADFLYTFYNINGSTFDCSNGKKIPIRLQRFSNTSNSWTDFSNYISYCNGSGPNNSGDSTKINCNPQGGYNLALAVKPDNENMIYFSGDQLYRLNTSTNALDFIGGDQGSPSGTNMHVDCHYLKFSDNNTLWSCNDGGIHKTDVTGNVSPFPQGFTWTRRTANYNGYQFYRADITPTSGNKFVGGGAQDNANSIIPDGTTDAIELGGGDGVQFGVINGTSGTNFNVITSTQEGSMYRRTNGGGAVNMQPTDKKTGFKTFFLLDADNSEYLYYPATDSKIYRTRIASTLADPGEGNSNITGDPTTGYQDMPGLSIGGVTIAVASRNTAFSGNSYAASNSSRRMYVGTSGGKVFRVADPAFCTSCTPSEITPSGLSGNGYVSDIAINPQNDNELLVTVSNYGVNGVYHTTNANDATPTWNQVEGGGAVSLASVRSALILVSGTTPIYLVGTSTGLYGADVLNGSSTNWQKIGGGINQIGNSVCGSMRLRTADNHFVVGTHGSGLFVLNAPPSAPLPVDLASFSGKKVQENALLSWEVSNISGNPIFIIERSIDGQNFEKIGEVRGDIRLTHYESIDKFPIKGINYYRLRIMDADKFSKYSNIISVKFDDKFTSSEIAIYPNPINEKGQLNISKPTDLGDISFTIYNSISEKMKVGQLSLNDNTINIENLAKGLYYVQFNTLNKITTHKLIIE